MNIEFEGAKDPDGSVRLLPKNLPEGKYFHFLLRGSEHVSGVLFDSSCQDCPILGKSCTGIDNVDNWGFVHEEKGNRLVKHKVCHIPRKVIQVPEEGLSIWGT